ncbi:Cof-type HAD-IIB family hydrolase [Collinsella intestinalis]|uniref:Cof-type HAD-IIB family hydrolase n=1 Tax=Collinsella intestinalis TaxID=147207 RepID=UPI0025A42C76|nr:Cof-type HAD-IIB family hydrolase [Collinsella intestinalis]MDM8163392.1 Cof-type HAD-IIB family hydrolase [Collinsella intestinalis]
MDGTLVSFRTHGVAASAREALRRLRQAGERLFIATGRSSHGVPQVIRSLAEEIPFDGYLTFNGQYCYTADGTVYRDVPLDVRDVHAIAEKADAGRFDLQVMQLSRTFVNRRSERVSRAEANVAEITPVLDLSHIDDEPVYQLCAFVDPGEEHVFADACAHVTHTRWCDAFCDVIPTGGGKPAGIAATLERWVIAPEDCIAFGDGGNDVPMFGCVGVSVAMGNASDAVKAAATHVAPDIDEDGLYVACKDLGLI